MLEGRGENLVNWGLLIVGGFLLTALAQFAACIAAFRHDALAGLLSLFVPGYLFLALRRSGAYRPVIGAWLAGVVAIVAGTVAMA